MNATQTTSLQPGTMTTPGHAHPVGAPQGRPAERRAAIGSGGFVTPAVAAHMRRKMADTSQRSI